ncbi:DUF805 domain-containing protein [Pigmentibacter ruber]|uniref:DUF805 domain-containing protein n=1 Tax=Pigmentibacter ruber TaxID=2683196 RepID=UPI00131D7738
MRIISAIRLGLLNFNNTKIRSGRAEYWYFVIFLGLVNIILIFFSIFFVSKILSIFIFNTDTLKNISIIMIFIFLLIHAFLYLIITIRRLHDINKSGWNIILCFIPILSLIILFYCILPGDKFINNYGKPSTLE